MAELVGNLLERLCQLGKHDWAYSPSGLVGWCRRTNCDAHWEYD